jgi:DNA repair protein RadC
VSSRRSGEEDAGEAQGSFLEAPLPSHTGHRQRLKDRFLTGGRAAIADYELLELVLFNAIPQRDTKSPSGTFMNAPNTL